VKSAPVAFAAPETFDAVVQLMAELGVNVNVEPLRPALLSGLICGALS